jgi:hypothetical protein
MTIELTLSSIFVSEEAAFGSPEWAYLSNAFWAGDNALTDLEKAMCRGYHRHKRPDRAKALLKAGIHQRLHHFIGNQILFEPQEGAWKLLLYLQGTHNAFYPEKSYHGPLKIKNWVESMYDKYADDDFLGIVSHYDFDNKDTRCASLWYRWEWRVVQKWGEFGSRLKGMWLRCIADPGDGYQ